ncbi:MAG: LCP family protein [Anaerovoracaceae bacterium]|nr:LCP family protein [Anaerovoracaceae bacterium]
MKKSTKIILSVSAILLIASLGAYMYVNSQLNKINRVEIKKEKVSAVEVKGYTNILLLGVDSRDIKNVKGSRSDAIMIATINNDTNDITVTSIYRDTYLQLGEDGVYDKINHAVAIGGPEKAIKSINEALDLNITEYVLFNFKTVSDAVDAVGGIDVDVTEEEINQLNKYTKETADIIGKKGYGTVKQAGPTTLYGPQAVAYGRIRKGVGDDFKRTERMRYVIKELLQKIRKQDSGRIREIIMNTLPQLTTNLSNKEIMNYGLKLPRFNDSKSNGFPYNKTTGMLNGVSYVFAQNLYNDVINLHEDLFKESNYVPSDKVKNISDNVSRGM